MTFMPAHKDTKTPPGQLVFSSSPPNTEPAVSETTLAHYITRKQDSFDRYPYLKHGYIAEPSSKPKLTFEAYWNKQGFDTDSYMLRLKPEFKLCWDAAQENK